MSKKLDRSKDFGTITPPYDGAVFSQDGYFFDGSGNLCKHIKREYQHNDSNTSEKKLKKAKKKAEKAVADPVAVPVPDEPENVAPDTTNNIAPKAADEVNLALWALQEQGYQWFTVRKAIRERFSVVVADKAAAIDLLIEKDVITSEQIKSLATAG